MKMHKRIKKALAAVLTAVMITGLVPVNSVPVHAEETTVAETGLVWDLSTVGALETTENFKVGEFDVIAGGSTVKVNAVTDVMSDSGEAFAWKLALGGSGNTGKRAVSFTVPSASTVTVWSRSTGDGDRTLAVTAADGTVVTNMTAVGKANTVLSGTTVKLAPGKYYIYSTGSGIDIYDIVIKTDINLDLTDVELNSALN